MKKRTVHRAGITPNLKQANTLEAMAEGAILYRWLSLSGTWRFAIEKPGEDAEPVHHALGRNLIRFGWVKFVEVSWANLGSAHYEISKKGLAAVERRRADTGRW